MIAYVINDALHAVPATIDASRTPSITLWSDDDIKFSSAVPYERSGKQYTLDLTNVADETVITATSGNSTAVFTVYNADVDYSSLESWLTMQQLSYLIPVLKKHGYAKLKEATLKARQISDMQGTEQALRMMLKLLEADNNVELFRYWRHESELGTDIAFDNLTATDLADLGYALTGQLKLQYKQDKLNPWSDKIEDTVQALLTTLDELVQCIRQVLPATLEISDYELIRVGIGMIEMQYMTGQSTLQNLNIDIDVPVDIPSTLQYSYEPFVYDLQTKELIRLAKYNEVNAYGRAMVVLQITVAGTIYDLEITIGDMLLKHAELTGTKRFCILPPIGKATMTYSYITESGNRFTKTKDVNVLPCCDRQDIYELREPDYDKDSAMNIEEGNISAFMHQWMQVSEGCNGRPNKLCIPLPYQQFYVPKDRLHMLKVLHADGTCNVYEDFNVCTEVEGFTVQLERVKLVSEYSMQDTDGSGYYYVLTSVKPIGRYDVTMLYSTLDEYDVFRYADSIAKILTSTVQPFWNKHTLTEIFDMIFEKNSGAASAIGFKSTMQLYVDDLAINGGGFIDVPNLMDARFCDLLRYLNSIVVNADINTGEMLSLSTIANETLLTVNWIHAYFGSPRPGAMRGWIKRSKTFTNKQVARMQSFSLRPIDKFKASVPYVAYRPNTWIELYSNGKLIRSAYGLLVFAKFTGNDYKLHMHNDWFDKTIDL